MLYVLPEVPNTPAEVSPAIAANRGQFPTDRCPGSNCPDGAHPAVAGISRGSGRISAFLDDIIAGWNAPAPEVDPSEAAALLAQLSALVPNLVINAQTGADHFEVDELRCWGICDRRLSNFVRFPESPDYLRGYLQACQEA